MLLRTDALPATIRDGSIANIRSIIEQSSGIGMQSMDNTLMKLFNDGKITAIEAYMKSINKADFEKILTEEDKITMRG